MRNNKKRICVIGLGQFGSEMARQLAEKCDVLALDIDEERVNAIADDVQQALIVDAKDFGTLASLVSKDFDEAIVSLGESMEASILCTLHLKQIGVRVIRAKAMSDDHATILRSIGATETIFPERETARRIAAQIMNPNLLDFIPLAEGFEVMDVAPPDEFCGLTLAQLNLRERFGAFVIGVKELVPPNFVFLPGPDFVVKPSDILVMIGRRDQLTLVRALNE
jgi:trk system potassium uptake protein TrkA|uniref:TrkA family potassium uptake protein n=1 Tax=Desulfomonile tiedjei TaxID=2358 RepID=A0A7C4AT63_9BACT